MVGSASDLLKEQFSLSGDEIHSLWNWVLGLGFLNNSEFSLTQQPAWNALLSGLLKWASHLRDCTCCSRGMEETVEHAFYHSE